MNLKKRVVSAQFFVLFVLLAVSGLAFPSFAQLAVVPKVEIDNTESGVNRKTYGPAAGFTASAPATPLNVDSNGETVTFTSPFAQVIAYNNGTSTAFCGNGPTPSTNGIGIAPGGAFLFNVTASDTQLSCITTGSNTTTMNFVPGSGSLAASSTSQATVNIPNPLPVTLPGDAGQTVVALTAADANNGSPQTWINPITGATQNGFISNPTASSSIAYSTASSQSARITLISTAGNAVLSVEGSPDAGTHYFALNNLSAVTVNSSGNVGATLIVPVTGYSNIRVRQTTCNSTCSTSVNIVLSNTVNFMNTPVMGQDGSSNYHNIATDTHGNVVEANSAPQGNWQYPTTTGQTGTGTVNILSASGSASLHEYMSALQIGRSDTGTSAITATITDGSVTYKFVVPNSGGGGGNNINFPIPIQFAANTAVTCAASAGVTTFYCTAQGFNAP